MDDDEIYNNLPDDPCLAFVRLESHFRQQYEQATASEQESSAFNFHQATYLNKVIASAKTLEIPGIKDYELPENEKNLWDFFRLVSRDTESLVVQIRIANSQSVNRYSVALSSAEKDKARHFITQLDELVDGSDCTTEKKEALKKKLNELRGEFEQDRTRFDRITDRIRAIASLSGDVEREGAAPWWPWIKALFGVIDEAKEKEERLNLPRRKETKKIEAPRKQLPDFSRKSDLDDEVPF